jgi:hypothetical protein
VFSKIYFTQKLEKTAGCWRNHAKLSGCPDTVRTGFGVTGHPLVRQFTVFLLPCPVVLLEKV